MKWCFDSASKKRIFSGSCICISPSEWTYMLYREISVSKKNTKLPNRTVFNVCIQLTELNCCVFAVVCKPFLWRSRKEIFIAKSNHLRNSGKPLSKTHKKVLFKLFCCLLNQLRELNMSLDLESLKHVSSGSCVLIFKSEWQ